MNQIFQKILQNPVTVRPFLQWYNEKYIGGLVTFQNLPFSHQIGVYLEYFETLYELTLIVSNRGYTVHFKDGRVNPIFNNNLHYNHHKFDYNEPKSIIYGYELGIMWMFENNDLPF